MPLLSRVRHALKVLSRLQTGLSDSRPLSSRALYRCLVRGAASDGPDWRARCDGGGGSLTVALGPQDEVSQ